LLLTPDRDAVVGPAREGLALVRDAAPEFFPRAAMGMGEALRGTADIDELYSVAREIRTVDNPYYNIFGLYWEALALLGRPDLAAVSDVASELIDEGARRRQRVMSWCGYQTRATLHVLFGRFDDAVADIDSMATYADSIGDTGVGAVHYARVSLAMKRRDVGMLVEAISALEKDFPAFSFGNGHIIIGQLDNSLTPAELGAEVAAWVDQALPRLPFSFRSGSIALLAPSLRFASPDTAVRAERELDGFDDIWMSTGCQESSGHCRWTRGLLAMAQGRTDAAIDHYEAALTSHVAAGELTVRANNSYYLVEALLERDLAGDSERARVVAAEAAAIADRVGIIGLADLVTALAD
jgi:hypothetical protein